ncbi:hypothetical protein [Halosimplex halophilum]|uniref:hypothetical protein n=1 Tax=Halosimplex halophilum TaxID=2559572 RepID=UPI0014354BB9|nr:hypothetical protein [Halosimplex halophilum]
MVRMDLRDKEKNEEVADTVSSTVPLNDREIQSDDILSKFTIEEFVVKKYQDANEWENRIGGKHIATLMLTYLSFVLVSYSLDNHISVSDQQESIIYLIAVGVPMLVSISLWFSKKIFNNRAEKQLTDHDEAIYHRLSRSIKEFERGNITNSREELEECRKLMSYDGPYALPPEFSKELQVYMKSVEDRNSDQYFTDTFPEVANKILQCLATVYVSDLKYLYTEDTQLEQADGYTPVEMIKSYLGDRTKSRAVRIVVPYIIVSPIIYAIYLQNTVLAQILTVIVVGVVQTYNRPDNEN